MEYPDLYDRVEDLSDIEVVILLSLIANEHCVIDTERNAIDDLENELILVAQNIFGLTYAVLNCSPDTTLDEFSNAVLFQDTIRPDYDRLSTLTSGDTDRSAERLPFRSGRASRDKSGSQLRTSILDDRKVVNVVIAKNFDQTSNDVQIQALELIRTKRIYTRTAVHSAPASFLFIPLVESKSRALSSLFNRHLIDHFFISYYHDPQDGFPNLEDDTGWFSDDQGSMSSVVHKPSITLSKDPDQAYMIREEHLNIFRGLSSRVTSSADVNAYLQNIVIFLRMNRGVAGGISAAATRHFHLLARCLAPLQRTDFIVPSLVDVAARRVYRHRIAVAEPGNDRSLMYGSTFKAVDMVLAEATPEAIIEESLPFPGNLFYTALKERTAIDKGIVDHSQGLLANETSTIDHRLRQLSGVSQHEVTFRLRFALSRAVATIKGHLGPAGFRTASLHSLYSRGTWFPMAYYSHRDRQSSTSGSEAVFGKTISISIPKEEGATSGRSSL
ncbi:hypothetical protein FQN52_002302 [Onygenales sp. PD_12]|nr:hypothetical protein FQN52_002302 [Onygenales sp. PD_12]